MALPLRRGVDGAPEDRPVDAALWAAALKGDGEAFGVLFDRHQRAVYACCYRRLRSTQVAEEATSTTFLELWRTRDRLVLVEGSCRPWLLGTANNVLRNMERAERRRLVALSRVARDDTHTEDHASRVAEVVDGERLAARLLEALDRLPARDRDLVSLVLLGRLSARAAGLVLGLPEGTVKFRVHRLRARLADELEPAPDSDTGKVG